MRLLLLVPLAFGCASMNSKKLVVPPEMRRPVYSGAVAKPAPAVKGAGAGAVPASTAQAKPIAPSAEPSQRTVLRLASNGRLWEVELPETSGAYELRIPLDDTRATQADEKLLAGADPGKKSYLAGLAHVRELYDSRKYELAFIDLNDLEQGYPRDARLLAMKGTLYLKLGKLKLARETWQQVVALDPNDTQTAEALRGLKEE